MPFEYDMIVIGAGAAGLTAAGMAALLGAKTALIERRRLGGDCTWTGCIPSKTLLRAASAAHQIRTADRFGLVAPQPQVDFSKLMDHVWRTRQQVYEDADAPPNMERLGVEVVLAGACFLDPHTVRIENDSGERRTLTSRFFIIATGSRARMPAFSAIPLTNETLFELRSQPNRLLILGAGPVGIEMAQAFRRLGSDVQVVASGERILPRDDPEHAGVLQQCLEGEGVTFHFGRKVTGLEKGENDLAAALDDGRTLRCDAVLAAIGREPVIEQLQLENAGVRTGEKGILVDPRCRTSQKHIYAAGDVTGRFNFTHMAEHMSKVAVTNALLRWPQKLDERHVVWSTFTDPELAYLGESEARLRHRNARYTVARFPFAKLDRAITEGESAGEVKIFASRSGRILGASILGARAGEMISEYALAMRNGLRLSQIARTVHPYPTFLLGNRRAADEFVARQLDSPLLSLLGRILRYRGQRKGSRALSDHALSDHDR
ncbi:MAG: FAD-dependent oxidoreductase [Terriglobia bacterium]